jgi:hypothetical protein
MLGLILLVFAFVLCVIQAIWFGPWPKPHLGWLGMALFLLYLLLGTGRAFGHL